MQTNKNESNRKTHRICDRKILRVPLITNVLTFVYILDDFVNYCGSIDKTYEKSRETKNGYKLKDKEKIILTEKFHKIATTFEVSCSRCK